MLLAFPNDYICSSDAWRYQYMLGNEMLVAPVYGDFNTMEIYLPQGHDWIDCTRGFSKTEVSSLTMSQTSTHCPYS